MKRVYERPVMMAEVYETNAYCGACEGQVTLTGTLSVKQSDGNWFSSNNGTQWNENGGSYEHNGDYVLSHSFTEANKIGMIFNGNQQHYWKCNDAGCNYYLEYSARYSNQNDAATFFLYMEHSRSDTAGLDPAWSTGPWPAYGDNGRYRSDVCVAQVRYTEDSVPMVSS